MQYIANYRCPKCGSAVLITTDPGLECRFCLNLECDYYIDDEINIEESENEKEN